MDGQTDNGKTIYPGSFFKCEGIKGLHNKISVDSFLIRHNIQLFNPKEVEIQIFITYVPFTM